jgi:hypothetical protein
MSAARRTLVGLVVAAFLSWALAAAMLVARDRVHTGRGTRMHDLISQRLFDAQGDPLVVANASVHWLACRTPASCGRVNLGWVDQIAPGQTAASTRFEAVSRRGGYELTSPWRGRLRALSPPRLVGSIRVGGRVRSEPARWTGGWSGDYDALDIEACRTPDGTGCETLDAPTVYDHPREPARTRIPAWYAGWYVQALDQRIPADTVFPLQSFGIPPPITRDGTVSASPPVRVPGRPFPVPRVTLRKRAVRRHGRLLVGRVACARCTVHVSVLARRGYGFSIHVVGSAALTLPGGTRPLGSSIEVHVTVRQHTLVWRVVHDAPG